MRFNKIILLLTAFFLIMTNQSHAQQNQSNHPRPNIIIILTDDMGYSDIGCYGAEISTPNLDALAADGLRFTQFYNTARCCPTRASLLTGQHPHRAGIGHMTDTSLSGAQSARGYSGDLNKNTLTIAEVLRGAGYKTYMSGKWHVTRFSGKDGPKDNWPMQRGFDKFYGTITGAGSYFDPTTLCRNNTFITPKNDPDYKPQQFYYTDAIADNAIAFLEDHKNQNANAPFFMYVAFTAAHWPMQALPEDIAKYKGRYDAGYDAIRQARWKKENELGVIDASWPILPTVGDWDKMTDKAWDARNMEVYAAMIDRLDQNVGKLIAELKKENQFDNTLIFYLHDNGGCAEGMGREASRVPENIKPFGPDDLQPSIWPPMQTRDGRAVRSGPTVMAGAEDTYIGYGRDWANVSNTPFREYKHWVHEGGIATPLIVHWPQGIALQKRGTITAQTGQLPDIMATCVDAAGANYPQEQGGNTIYPLAGLSLKPIFSTAGNLPPHSLFWEHEGNRAIRQGKWKLVAKGPQGSWELYDMTQDRAETNDIAAKHPELVQELAAQWATWARANDVLPWIWNPPYGETRQPQHFDLKTDDVLVRETSPNVGGASLKISIEVLNRGNGVLLAQGGLVHGYALFLRNDEINFVVRVDGKLSTLTATLPPGDPLHIKATLSKSGVMELQFSDDAPALTTKSAPLHETPGDALSIGYDINDAVGNYKAPFRFNGTIGKVEINVVP